MALPDLTGQKVNDTYQRLLQISASGDIVDGTGSLFIPPTAVSASYASYAVSASHEIIKEVSSSYADTASLAEELVSDKRATVKGYVYVAHGTTLQSGTTAALYLGTSNAGMDVARYNDNTLVIGGVTQYYGWRIFGIKHGLNSGIYTTEIDNLIATGSINVSGSLDISLASGSAFTITEHDIDQQNRLTFEYDQGDPTLIVASRAGEAKLHLKQDLAGNGVEILNTGVFRRTVSSTIYGFSIATTSLQPITTNQLDLGYFNRRWKSAYFYTGNKLSWGTVTATDNVALNNPTGTNTLQITGSSDVTLDVKGVISASGDLYARDGRFQRSPSHAEVEVIGTTDYGLIGTHTNDNFALRRFNITKFTVSESRNVSNQQLHVEGSISSSALSVNGTTRTLYTTASIVYSGSNITQVTQSFNGGTQQITNITYSGSFADGNPETIVISGSDGINKTYTLTYSGTNITQILVT